MVLEERRKNDVDDATESMKSLGFRDMDVDQDHGLRNTHLLSLAPASPANHPAPPGPPQHPPRRENPVAHSNRIRGRPEGAESGAGRDLCTTGQGANQEAVSREEAQAAGRHRAAPRGGVKAGRRWWIPPERENLVKL